MTDLNKLARRQLTHQELVVLRLRRKLDVPETARLLGLSQSRIKDITAKANKKIEAQNGQAK